MSETLILGILTAIFGFLAGLIGSLPVAFKLRAETKISAKKADLEALQITVNELLKENQRLRDCIHKIETESDAKDVRIDDLKKRLDETEDALDDRNKRVTELEAELERLQQKVAKLDKRTGELKLPDNGEANHD